MKNLCFIVILLGISGFTYSQKLDGGLFAGLSTSQVDGDGQKGYNMSGVNLGFFSQIDIGEKSNLRLELAFLQKGAKEPVNDSTGCGYCFKLKLNYIEIPIVYILNWKDLAFEAGLGADILVSEKASNLGGSFDSPVNYKRLSMMLLFGVTYNFGDNWGITLRTNHSVTPISDVVAAGQKPSITALGGYGMRNDVLTFALVYKFNK
ncbi:porin family protein [Owenweeksia hongkongensis]|uniref:porin family protein n=1 Tax=Owenweeksia hongkongensis TaxID=253245 RepID=UPI003A94F897